VQQYWAASKCRLDRWTRNLKSFAADATLVDATAARVNWPYVRGVMEEILTGEVLARVWTCILRLCDQNHKRHEMEAVGRSILIGHLEARHRVLLLLVRGPGVDAEGAVKLNALRRRAERWTDLLVGYLSQLGDVSEFAFDPERARDFRDDLCYQANQPGARQAWPLLQASLRSAFHGGLAIISPNEDINAQIASAILSCFPGDLFDSTGKFRSLWMDRMMNVTSDVEGMIDSLIVVDESSANKRFRG